MRIRHGSLFRTVALACPLVLVLAPSCPAGNVLVRPFRGAHRVPAIATTLVKIRIHMRSSALGSRKGQRYNLDHRGWATRA